MKNPRITQSEIEIIKKAQAGDMRAFNTLFNKYKTFVENILNEYLNDLDEAKDITNVVFLKVYNKLSTFKADSFGGWLRTITVRTAIDYLRETKHKLKPSNMDDNGQLFEMSDGSTESGFVNRISYDQILLELNKLPEQTREICLLFYKDGFKVRRISEILDVPEGTVKSVLHRIRKKLKRNIKNY